MTVEDVIDIVDRRTQDLRDATLRWTSEPPKEPGWYWVSKAFETDDPAILKITRGGDGTMLAWEEDHVWEMDKFYAGRRWAGPIPEPE